MEKKNDRIEQDLLKNHQEYITDKEGLHHAKIAMRELEAGGKASRVPSAGGNISFSGRFDVITVGLSKRYIRYGGIDYLGSEINSPEDLAAMMQAYRNPLFETARVFYLQNNRLICTEGLSNRLPGIVEIAFPGSTDTPENHIQMIMKETNADSFYFLHNHPTGNPTPSFADIGLTQRIGKVNGFLGHIIINHKTYALLDENGNWEKRTLPGNEKDPLLTPSLNHPLLNRPIKNADMAAQLGRDLEVANNKEISYLAYTDLQRKITTLQEVSNDIFLQEDFTDWLSSQKNQYGANLVFCVTSNLAVYDWATEVVQERHIADIIYLDPDYSIYRSKMNELSQILGKKDFSTSYPNFEQKNPTLFYEKSSETGTYHYTYALHPEKCRIFVDIDGTLAVFTPVNKIETLYEEGYFRNLEPHKNTIAGLKMFMKDNPEIEVYILSSVLADSPYALDEKQAWLDQYLPEINREHRIFPPCGAEKADYVPGKMKSTDILLDDYSKNLIAWKNNGGTGLKLMNGINGTKGSWQGYTIPGYNILPEHFYSKLTGITRQLGLTEIAEERNLMKETEQTLCSSKFKDFLAQRQSRKDKGTKLVPFNLEHSGPEKN